MTNDTKETWSNTIIGGVLNCLLTQLMFGVTPTFAISTTGVFFIVSWIRCRLIRKYYRSKEDEL